MRRGLRKSSASFGLSQIQSGLGFLGRGRGEAALLGFAASS
jgi:hypothetical protein